MQILIMQYHYKHIRIVKMQKTGKIKCSCGYRATEILQHCYGNAKMIVNLLKSVVIFCKVKYTFH